MTSLQAVVWFVCTNIRQFSIHEWISAMFSGRRMPWTGATPACDPRYLRGGGFRGRDAGGWPCQNHPTVRSRAYMYRRSRRGTLYVQRCTIKPPSSWQDARRKTPNDLFSVLSLSFYLSPLLFSSFVLPFLLSVLFRRSCLLRLYLLSIPFLSPSPFGLYI